MIKKVFIVVIFFLFVNQSKAEENLMILKLKDGDVKIELFEDIAPNHVKRTVAHPSALVILPAHPQFYYLEKALSLYL